MTKSIIETALKIQEYRAAIADGTMDAHHSHLLAAEESAMRRSQHASQGNGWVSGPCCCGTCHDGMTPEQVILEVSR